MCTHTHWSKKHKGIVESFKTLISICLFEPSTKGTPRADCAREESATTTRQILPCLRMWREIPQVPHSSLESAWYLWDFKTFVSQLGTTHWLFLHRACGCGGLRDQSDKHRKVILAMCLPGRPQTSLQHCGLYLQIAHPRVHREKERPLRSPQAARLHARIPPYGG